ncbi:penicillin-binding protein activator [Roseomonas sp. OT10]|uniref:penicillin-binding protein activator n=1 Tax=Roseomonas cutis TaxID=2897332 RepID=UPI001E4156AF|nr:penicillin-binding protein activator [Roseomonas sp. OT10]UFN48145.1 penicillin-binding protein activator [Roseomonas sp. OT10]
MPVEAPRARVALLLPLTGSQAPLGRSMLNAATLALFEQSGPAVEFLPRDTGGSPAGAAEAARSAIAEGARVIVGPLTSAETGSVAAVARASNVPVLAFTNDANLAGRGAWVLGITPAQQVRRLVQSAQGQGVRRIALAAPSGPFATQLAAALRTAAQDAGLPPPLVVTYPQGAAMSMAARELASRVLPPGAAPATPDAAVPGSAAPGAGLPPEGGPEPVGLLILGESGARARQFAAALPEAGLAVPPLRLAGHALWAQEAVSLAQEPALAGAWFPAPDSYAHAQFEDRYQQAFGDRPPRLAATAYDAATVAVRAARNGPEAPLALPLDEIVLGGDGALRLLPDGQTQRALAVFALEPGAEPRVVEPATLPGAAGS